MAASTGGSVRPTRHKYSNTRAASPSSTLARVGSGPPHRLRLAEMYAGHSARRCRVVSTSGSPQLGHQGSAALPIRCRISLVSGDLPTRSWEISARLAALEAGG